MTCYGHFPAFWVVWDTYSIINSLLWIYWTAQRDNLKKMLKESILEYFEGIKRWPLIKISLVFRKGSKLGQLPRTIFWSLHPSHLILSDLIQVGLFEFEFSLESFGSGISTKVVYMCFSLLQLAPGSRDLSQAEKRIGICYVKLFSLKMTTLSIQCCF